jgi:hypothetical protein
MAAWDGEERRGSCDQSYSQEERRGYCPREREMWQFAEQAERIDKFIEEAAPLMAYVKAEIKRNDARAELYSKITEHVLGAGVLAIFSSVGYWIIMKLKSDFGIGK